MYYDVWFKFGIVYQKDSMLGALPLMQYTNLKDRTGREIFEGDILRASQGQPRIRMVEWQNKGKINGFNVAKGVWYEVIGNIYENPELLN